MAGTSRFPGECWTPVSLPPPTYLSGIFSGRVRAVVCGADSLLLTYEALYCSWPATAIRSLFEPEFSKPRDSRPRVPRFRIVHFGALQSALRPGAGVELARLTDGPAPTNEGRERGQNRTSSRQLGHRILTELEKYRSATLPAPCRRPAEPTRPVAPEQKPKTSPKVRSPKTRITSCVFQLIGVIAAVGPCGPCALSGRRCEFPQADAPQGGPIAPACACRFAPAPCASGNARCEW